MDFISLQNTLNSFSGQEIVQKNIVGNTILLWIGCLPKEDSAKLISIDPPWRLEKSGYIQATSADLPWQKEERETEEQYKTRLETACSLSNSLIGAKLLSVNIDQKTSDLTLLLSNELVLRSFVVWRQKEADTDSNWYFRDYKQNMRYRVSVDGVFIEQAKCAG